MAERPKRIQRSRAKGWRMPEGAIYVGRPTKWGNPFQIVKMPGGHPAIIGPPQGTGYFYNVRALDEMRGRAVDLYRQWWWTREDKHLPLPELAPLRGHDLACWCPLDQPCHADVLLELANA